MFKKILIAITPTGSNNHILEEAIALAKLTDGELMLLHVLSPSDEGYPTPIYPSASTVYETALKEVAIKNYAVQWEAYEQDNFRFTKALTAQAASAGVKAEFTQSPGDAGHVICKLAETWNADLIMLGRRGHSGLKELFLGSVSNYVLHHAPCSVLTIQGAS
ncbi:universal stress protein [Phormidium sp. CLA17]|uniref:universal stress protein n=1 Tax=Leptolyngbya sp. Cla-17 TaxID=2803751 RepID=UPI00149283FC|nr:universal stress protein [Leptolyngbya sp. Cla-17]MBM0740426.1 universal stress protein [Leptolyngbya sp. Cla-17]